MTHSGIHPSRLVAPGSSPLLELAHAIADALTLPGEAVTQAEPEYLRVSRDHVRVVLFAMRRIIAARDVDDITLMGIACHIRHQTGQLEDGDVTPADRPRRSHRTAGRDRWPWPSRRGRGAGDDPVSRTSLQLESAALAVPCGTHRVPAGAECPEGGACMDRYGIAPDRWGGWFERDGFGAAPAPR